MIIWNSIWNAAIASLQFWTADLDPVTIARATEQVYTTFFYSPSSHTLHQQSDKILFGCFLIALNAVFDQQLSLADEGYESDSDSIDLPTPLRKTPESTMFPAWNMPHSIQHLSHHTITTNSNQTSMKMTIIQFNRRHHSSQHSRMFRRWSRGRGLPDGTSKWWTLGFWGNTWKNIVHSQAWISTWVMPIPMPLCKLSDAFLHGQLGLNDILDFEDYGYIQWWRHTSIWGYTLLRDILVWFEHYIIY